MKSSGKDLLIRALKGETTERPAWVPFVGVHGGYLTGVNSTEYLQSAEKIVAGLEKSIELYAPDGLPVVFDLQVEAEILGCDLAWADEVPPSVVSHPLMGDAAVDDLPAYDTSAGRFPLIKEVCETLIPKHGNEIAFYGLITGPFTLTSHLRGSELFIDMMMDPERTHATMAHAADIAKKTADFYLDLGCAVIAVVDPMTSQISPDHFNEFVSPYVNEVFNHIREKGALSSLFVCGDATRNLEVMCRTTCDNVSVDENIPLDLLVNLCRKNGKSAGGNLKLTTVLLLGKEADAMLDAIRCIDIGGSEGFVLAPGCDLPYGVPQENLVAVSNMVRDEYQRQVARTTAQVTDFGDFSDVVVPEFSKEEKVILDVITLDSSGCAPCLYMLDATIKAAQKCGVPTEVREHKIKSREGIGYMIKMGVENIPTVVIDGEVKFISQIPDGDTFVSAIETRAKEMGKS